MNSISKATFIYKHQKSDIRLDHLSDRQIDYKYLEYNLYIILSMHRQGNDFSLLSLPDNLEIVTYPSCNNYNIYTRTHVTLNSELYKLYSIGYFKSDAHFISYVTSVIKHYKTKKATIKNLVKVIRSTRIKYEKEYNL